MLILENECCDHTVDSIVTGQLSQLPGSRSECGISTNHKAFISFKLELKTVKTLLSFRFFLERKDQNLVISRFSSFVWPCHALTWTLGRCLKSAMLGRACAQITCVCVWGCSLSSIIVLVRITKAGFEPPTRDPQCQKFSTTRTTAPRQLLRAAFPVIYHNQSQLSTHSLNSSSASRSISNIIKSALQNPLAHGRDNCDWPRSRQLTQLTGNYAIDSSVGID